MPAPAVEEMPPVFTHGDALERGVSDRVLYGWRDSALIEQIARGIFAQPDLPADLDLIEIAVRAPDATLCLTTALARHDLSDDIPTTIHAALPRKRRAPRTAAPVTWHRFDEDTFDIGGDELTVYGDLTIGIYDPVLSIIDAFRLRHRYGEDLAVGAVRRWLARRESQPSELVEIAGYFPAVEPSLRNVLQILL